MHGASRQDLRIGRAPDGAGESAGVGDHGGSKALAFTGSSSAAKLKIMGVEIFSAGSIDESEPGVETVRYEDPSLGIYKRLFLKDNRLRGVILVGDISDERRYTGWLREETDLSSQRRHLLFPPPVDGRGSRSRRHAGKRDRLRLQRRQQGRPLSRRFMSMASPR